MVFQTVASEALKRTGRGGNLAAPDNGRSDVAPGNQALLRGAAVIRRPSQLAWVQRASSGDAAAHATAPPIVGEVLRQPGAPLDAATRAVMEPRFGADFGAVRVHSDAKAAASARAVDADAYTVGRDIVFAADRHAPHSAPGQRLIAHELTHVLQQGGSTAAPAAPRIGPADDASERQAERWATVATDAPARAAAEPVRGANAALLQRQAAADADKIHDSAIEQFRREQGFPPGGVDDAGKRVGPTDAEIKYQLMPRWTAAKIGEPYCPWPSDFDSPHDAEMAMKCVSPDLDGPRVCTLGEKHLAQIEEAKVDARRRVQKAYFRMHVKGGPEYAQGVAARIFDGTPPSSDTITTTLDKMKTILESGVLPVAGGTCADPLCETTRGSDPTTEGAHAAAYEQGPGKPVVFCTRSFLPDYLPEFRRTVIHEVAHLAGIDIKPGEEKYCNAYDCNTKCRDATVADAWTLFIDCLGGTLQPAAAAAPPAAAAPTAAAPPATP